MIENMTISIEAMVVVITVIVIPLVVWGLTMHSKLNTLVTETIVMSDAHSENTRAIQGLTYAVKELSHYMLWLGEQQTGKKPSPPIRKDIGR